MRAEDLRRQFEKVYPRCSKLEIDNLVSAILSRKYWRVHSESAAAFYAVALTRAEIPDKNGFKARSTAPMPVIVSIKAAKFCRRGRILVIRRRNGVFISDTIVDWPTFIRLMRMDQNLIYRLLIEDENPPAFLNQRLLNALLRKIK